MEGGEEGKTYSSSKKQARERDFSIYYARKRGKEEGTLLYQRERIHQIVTEGPEECHFQ